LGEKILRLEKVLCPPVVLGFDLKTKNMRYKYLPDVKKIPRSNSYIFGILEKLIVDPSSCIDTQMLFFYLKIDAYKVSDKLTEIFNNPNWKATGEINKYPVRGGIVEELIIVNHSEKRVSALYTTMICRIWEFFI
jgi:hypothetical protein